MTDEILIRAEDILNPNDLKRYKEKIDILAKDLVNLNHYLFFYEKIARFPFGVFAPMFEDRVFWNLTQRSFSETITMSISRILYEEPKQVPNKEKEPHKKKKKKRNSNLSIPLLRDFIVESAKSGEREKVEAYFKKVDFSSELENIREKIRVYRNKYVAHLDEKILLRENNLNSASLSHTTFSELQLLFDATVRLFNAVYLSGYYDLWYWGYENRVNDQTTDLEQALDNIAYRSTILTLYENDPESWEMYREDITDLKLKIINEYREKFGLPKIE